MKRIAILISMCFSLSVSANDESANDKVVQYVFKTANSNISSPSVEQCREAEYYQLTGVDAHVRHGSSFQKTKLNHSLLRAKQGEITDGYGCIWYQGSGANLKVFMLAGINTPIGTIKANGQCLPIAYRPTPDGVFAESNCLLNIEDNFVAQMYGITSGSLTSNTIFRIDGPQVEGVSGSVWILQSWGKPHKDFAHFKSH